MAGRPSSSAEVLRGLPVLNPEEERLEDYVSGYQAGFRDGSSGNAYPSVRELDESFRLLLRRQRAGTRVRWEGPTVS
ncbi:hypothetical protein QJS10_CPA09g01495 [Acorus calamus]|uniref:Uncharacterized protein n=1 Tax=Acorus calamus TaxID=4465 RepID=A0AAV9E5E9_ACOCL|nr:hypothetical protein QJS10_CPA09g01495 [Acorus calamus]